MSEYTSKDIKVLDEISHIRLAPGMYIGDTSNPDHLLEECFDNSLDECFAGHASIVAINIDTEKYVYSIIDNGRGIPIENDVAKIISTKLFSGAKFQGNKTSYQICCLIGSTKIMLMDGRHLTLEEMSLKPNDEYIGLSSTTCGKWEATKLLHPQITGYTKKLLRIHIDNGKYEDCTEDHKWLMKDGSYKKAKDLKSGDSLMPCYSTIRDGYTYIRPNKTYPYKRNIQYENRNYIPLHRIIYESCKGEIQKFLAVHHIDTDKQNNYPSNLTLLHSRLEHLGEHSKIASRNGTVNFDSLLKYNKSEQGRKKSKEIGDTIGARNFIEYAKSSKHKKDKQKFMQKYCKIPNIQIYLQKQKILKYARTLLDNDLIINESNWEKYRSYGIPKFNKSFDYFTDLSEMNNLAEIHEIRHDSIKETNGKNITQARIFSILKKLISLDIESYNNKRNKFDPSIKFIEKEYGSFESLVDIYSNNNHKVDRVETLILDDEVPVYDIYAPKNSNFVLSSGVVVHNSGMHGIGLCAVNALSTDYSIEIHRDGKHAKYNFLNAKYKSKRIIKQKGDSIPFSTKIQFTPDATIFESLSLDLDRIRRRLLVASVELPKCTFILNVDDKREIIKVDREKFFKDQLIDNSKKINLSTMINIESSNKENEKFNISFCYDFNGTISPKIISSVNILPVDSGGTHVNMFYDMLRDIFTVRAKKAGIKILPQDSLCGIRSYLSLSLIKPEFSGQNKSKMINRKSYLEGLCKDLKIKIENFFDKNPEDLNDLLEFFGEYRKKIDSKNMKGVVDGKRASTKFTKLRDCKSRNGELFIAEGDSACGGFISCRNPNIHAILPLKGKIPSIANAKDILKNKEIGELIQSLGTGIGPHFDIRKLKYSKIICACDADADGGHIASLLTLALAILVPEIIKQGKYYIVETPLYAINGKKSFIPLWNEEELIKAKKLDKPIIRLKGLGELNPDQLKQVTIDPKTRKLIPISFSKDIKKMTSLFIGAEEKRKLLSGNWTI